MVKWKELKMPRSRYISPIYSISNKLDKYIVTIEEDIHNPYYQTIEYYFQVSYDMSYWTEWKQIYNTSSDFLNEYELDGLYVRFSIVIISTSLSRSPSINSIKMTFKPYAHVENVGSLTIKPKIWIRKKNGAGNIQMINQSNGQIMELKNLSNNEEIFIDCENEEIISSNQSLGVYRYDDHNNEFIEFIKGDNYISFVGDYDWDTRYKAKLLQE